MMLRAWMPLALGVALAASPAMAQSILRPQTETTVNAVQEQSRQATEEPRAQSQGNVTYISGGVGTDGVRAMHDAAAGYNLRLMFAIQGSGEYLADVHVRLVDPQGRTVLDTVSDGPYFFAKVPPGHYRVVADANGSSQSRAVDLSGTGAVSQSFYWRS